MALVINDRVKETSSTTGTGTLTFAGAVSGFETFAAGIGNSSTTYYAVVNTDTPTEWEVGLGTLAGDSSTIARTTVISSSNSDSAVNFGSGTKEIFCTLPASKAVIKDASGNVTPSGVITGTTVEATGDTAASDNAAMGYTSAEGLILTGQGSTNDVTIKNDADADVITIATGATNVDVVGDLTAGTLNADGDTASGDNAAIGYTSAEGLILTGQGSTNDVTIKNDADTAVISIPTGATNVTIAGDLTISGDDLTMGTNTSGAALIADGTNFNPVVISSDATIATDGALTIANNAVSLAKMAGLARGKIIYGDSSGDPAALTVGSSGQALVSDGTDISWGSGGAISSYTNSGDNRIITSVNSSTVNGEANLSFDGSTLAVTGAATVSTTLGVTGIITGSAAVIGTTIEPTGDTSASDNAAFGYTSVLGAILTGQGSTNDVTLVNDADATVLGIATGTTNVDIVGDVTASTLNADGDTSASDNAAIGYTSAEGLILTGQGSTSDITLKNDADGTVFTIPTGTDDILFPDSAKSMWGAASDMTLYHDGSNSYITNTTGALKIATESSGIAITLGHGTSEVTVADNLTVTGTLTGTLATAAQANVTSLGTLTALTVDNVAINGATIGHTGDTDLITVASGIATVAGEVSMTTLDIGGTNVTSTAAELNILDGVTATAAELNILDGVTSTAAEINLLDALDRGSILYGNSSGATAVLGQGSANQLLQSDGTDISWATVSSGGYNSMDLNNTFTPSIQNDVGSVQTFTETFDAPGSGSGQFTWYAHWTTTSGGNGNNHFKGANCSSSTEVGLGYPGKLLDAASGSGEYTDNRDGISVGTWTASQTFTVTIKILSSDGDAIAGNLKYNVVFLT